jgi:ribosomal protein S20
MGLLNSRDHLKQGNGWSNSKSKTKNGHKEEKAKHTDNGHTSRFKTFLKGILKRKD